MSGRLALAGLVPDRTPLDEWVAAAFAVLVDSPRSGDDLDKALAELEKPLPLAERTDLDRDTWGMSPAAQEAQARLLKAFGG